MNQINNIRKLKALTMPGTSNSVQDISGRMGQATQANRPRGVPVNRAESETYNTFRHGKR
jgi:hypothetical protein